MPNRFPSLRAQQMLRVLSRLGYRGGEARRLARTTGLRRPAGLTFAFHSSQHIMRSRPILQPVTDSLAVS